MSFAITPEGEIQNLDNFISKLHTDEPIAIQIQHPLFRRKEKKPAPLGVFSDPDHAIATLAKSITDKFQPHELEKHIEATRYVALSENEKKVMAGLKSSERHEYLIRKIFDKILEQKKIHAHTHATVKECMLQVQDYCRAVFKSAQKVELPPVAMEIEQVRRAAKRKEEAPARPSLEKGKPHKILKRQAKSVAAKAEQQFQKITKPKPRKGDTELGAQIVAYTSRGALPQSEKLGEAYNTIVSKINAFKAELGEQDPLLWFQVNQQRLWQTLEATNRFLGEELVLARGLKDEKSIPALMQCVKDAENLNSLVTTILNRLKQKAIKWAQFGVENMYRAVLSSGLSCMHVLLETLSEIRRKSIISSAYYENVAPDTSRIGAIGAYDPTGVAYLQPGKQENVLEFLVYDSQKRDFVKNEITISAEGLAVTDSQQKVQFFQDFDALLRSYAITCSLHEFEKKVRLGEVSPKTIVRAPPPRTTKMEIEPQATIQAQEVRETHEMRQKRKDFAHVMADYAIEEKAQLEGNLAEHALRNMIGSLERILSDKELALSREPGAIESLLVQFQGCLDYSEYFTGIASGWAFREGKLDALAGDLKKRIDELKNGQSLLIPGGWRGQFNEQGHALLYEFTRAADGTITASMYNSGAGLATFLPHFPESDKKRAKIKYPPALSIVSIPSGNINDEFCRSIIDPLLAQEKASEKTEELVAKCYKPFLSLGGRVVINDTVSFKDLISPQRAGTCTWRCLLALLRKKLGFSQYKKCMKYLKKYKSQLYVDEFLMKPNPKAGDVKLAQKALRKFASSLRKGHDQKIISDEEFLAFEKWHTAVLAEIEKKQKTLAPQWREVSLATTQTVPLIPLDFDSTKIKKSEQLAGPQVERASEASGFFKTLPSRAICPTSEPQKLAQSLSELEKACSQCVDAGFLNEAEIRLTQFLLSLPAPTIGTALALDFWERVPPAQIATILNTLERLTDLYLSKCSDLSPPATKLIVAALSAAVTDKLIRIKRPDIAPYLHVPNLESMLEGRSAENVMLEFLFHEGPLAKIFCNLQNYAEQISSHSDQSQNWVYESIAPLTEFSNNIDLKFIESRLGTHYSPKDVVAHYCASKPIDGRVPDEYYQVRRQWTRYQIARNQSSAPSSSLPHSRAFQDLDKKVFAQQSASDPHCCYIVERGTSITETTQYAAALEKAITPELYSLLKLNQQDHYPKIEGSPADADLHRLLTISEPFSNIGSFVADRTVTIPNIIDFFQDGRCLGGPDDKWRLFVESCLFRPGLLEQFIRQATPGYIQVLLRWIQTAKENFTIGKDYNALLFFYSIQERLRTYNISGFEKNFPKDGAREELRKIIEIHKGDVAISRKANILLAFTFYGEALADKAQLLEFMKAYTACQISLPGNPEMYMFGIFSLFPTMQKYFHSKMPTLLAALDDKVFRRELFNVWARERNLVPTNEEVRLQFPRLVTSTMQYDLVTGHLYAKNQQVPLPAQIYADPSGDWAQLFGTQPKMVTQISADPPFTYEWQEPTTQRTYRVILRCTGTTYSYNIQRQIGKHWYQYDRNFPSGLKDANYFGSCQAWRSLEQENKWYISSQDGQSYWFKDGTLTRRKDTYILSTTPQETSACNIYGIFERFGAEKSRIQTWGIQKDSRLEIQAITIPSPLLHFDLDKENRFCLKEVPGFFLAKTQKRGGIIILENEHGAKKALMSRSGIMQTFANNDPMQPVPQGFPSDSYCVLDLRDDGEEFITTCARDALLAASYFFGCQEYERAQKHLNTFFQKKAGMDLAAEEKKMLQQIFLDKQSIHSFAPHDVAFRLACACFWIEGQKRVDLSQYKETAASVKTLYESYLNTLKNVPDHLLLSSYQEMTLCHFLEKLFPKQVQTEARLQFLRGEQSRNTLVYPPALAEFLSQAQKAQGTQVTDIPPRENPLQLPFQREFRMQDPRDVIQITRGKILKCFKRGAALPPTPPLHFSERVFSDSLLQATIEGFQETDAAMHTKEYARSITRAKFDKLKVELQTTQESCHAKCESLKKDIQELANNKVRKEGQDEVFLKRYELQKTAQLLPELTFEHILTLAVQQNDSEFQRLNPFLDQEEITQLKDLVAQFLYARTEEEYISRLGLKMALVEERLKATMEGGVLSDVAVRELYNELGAKRMYNAQSPFLLEFLLFEHAQNIRLRSKQVIHLETLLKRKDGTILQMIMGGGKSTVFLAILAMNYADGVHLPCIVVPKALYATNVNDLKKQSAEVFHQNMETFKFDPIRDVTQERLWEIFGKFQTQRALGGYIVTFPESLQDLEIVYAKLIDEYVKNPQAGKALEEQIEPLQKILKLLTNHGVAIFDEVDTILRRDKRRKHALGEFEPLDKKRFGVIRTMYEPLLAKDSKIDLRNNKQATHSPEQFQMAKELIVEKLHEFFGLKDKNAIASFDTYLSDKSSEPPAWIEKRLQDKDQIMVAREEFQRLFPLTLKRAGGEKYGFSRQNPSSHIAIPYAAANKPQEGSEFSSPYETLNYTIQSYFSQGVPLNRFTRWVYEEREKAMAEVKRAHERHETLAADKTEAALLFGRITGGKAKLFELQDQEHQALLATLNKDEKFIWAYLEQKALPEIGLYAEDCSADAYDLVDLFPEVVGFTGTPWNETSYHSRLQTTRDPTDEIRTVAALMKKQPAILKELLPQAQGLEAMMSVLAMNGHLKNYNALIDVGALFKNMPNKTVAETFLNYLPSTIQAIIYYGDDDRKYLLERGKEAKLLEESDWNKPNFPITPENTFTYYDQPHCFGADIVQHAKARALVSTSHDMLLKDLTQAIMRLRQFEKEQSCDFLVPEELEPLIMKSEAPSTKLDCETLITFALRNQLEKAKEHAWLGIGQKLEERARNSAFKNLLALSPIHDREKMKGLWSQARTLFIKSKKDDPYTQFSQTEKQTEIQSAIEDLKKAITGGPPQENESQFWQGISEKLIPFLTQKIWFSHQANRDFDSAQTVEKQIQMQTTVEQAVSIYSEKPKQPEWLFTGGYMDDLVGTLDTWRLEESSLPVILDFAGKEKILDQFSPRIVRTKNFTQETSSFTPTQPLAHYVLIYQKDAQTEPQVICLHPSDADEVYEFFSKGFLSKPPEGAKIGLLSLDNPNSPIFAHNYSDAEIQNPKVQELLVQLRFFNGDMMYRKEDLALLRRWIGTGQRAASLRALFEYKILIRNPSRKVQYPDSDLKKLFDELKVPLMPEDKFSPPAAPQPMEQETDSDFMQVT